MGILVFIIGLVMGLFLNVAVERISYNIEKVRLKSSKLLVSLVSTICFTSLYLRLSFSTIFIEAAILTSILIIVSFVDLTHRIIPDFMNMLIFIVSLIMILIFRHSFINSILGMIVGGGLLFLLALIPNAMGGGDIKLMFAVGAFLGLYKTLWTLMLAFAFSFIISLLLLVFKIKDKKDYIPFGPFLALGSFISMLI